MENGICLLILSLLAAMALCAAADAEPAPRLHERFDRGWRFCRGDAPEAWRADSGDSRWRAVDLPHDWAIEDLPASDGDALPALSIAAGTWRFKPGDDPAWKDPGLDDAGWQQVALPANWEAHSNYTEDNVYGWYRRRIALPAEMRGKDVLLVVGKVDDVDGTFVNGVKVGGLGTFPPNYQTAWDKPRRYRVPAALLKGDGTDVVAVRVFDGNGNGGLYASAAPPVHSGPFDSDSESGGAQGFTVGGIGWYRKSFRLPPRLRSKRIGITFDGVYMNATIWLNGQRLGEHPYGYTGLHFDLTPHARFGREQNVLAVRVDASGKTSRWYSGAGIYRHVWLTATDPVHVSHEGASITTPQASQGAARVRAQTTVANDGGEERAVVLRSAVVDRHGHTVAVATAAQTIQPGSSHEFDQALAVEKPNLWSPDSPALYRLVSTITAAGKVVDETQTPFGIRSLAFDADAGFRLNGKPLKLRGGCVHHDNGCLGACTYDRAEERRVELLKASGYNAIRTSHNPPSPAFLDACDRLGVVVIDEAFDCWRNGKNPQDYGRFFDAWWRQDIEAMVRRDRNHPSVILWSIGNELVEQGTPAGVEVGGMLARHVRALDATRPVLLAAHPGTPEWEGLDPFFQQLDVCGYNYRADKYAPDHERLPRRMIIGTESFPTACFDHWMATLDHPYVLGDFVWTAFDYLGEAALGHTHFEGEPAQYAEWPWNTAYCGDLDLCGLKRPQSCYRDVVWSPGPRVCCFVHSPLPPGKKEVVFGWGWPDERPSWTWPGHEGEPLSVNVYASSAQVRLVLNGKELGVKETNRGTRFMAAWEVPYEPGELAAVGLDGSGKEVARWTLRTAGKPAALRLAPDRSAIAADGQDLSFVTVEVVDGRGVLNPNADNLVRFRVSGLGKIIGVGNGDPRSLESFQQLQRKAFRGRCLVVVKAGERAGSVRLRAEAEGLEGAEVVIRVGAKRPT